jgi:protein TonB
VEKSVEKSIPQPQQSSIPPQQPESKSEPQAQNAAVAPSTSGGASGTPIQTDIGKLVVVYQPDADAYYPSFSKRSGEQGTVVVRLIIDETGSVEDVALLQSSSFPRLDRAASEIGRRYRFKPYLVNGSPQRISTNLLIKFNLK